MADAQDNTAVADTKSIILLIKGKNRVLLILNNDDDMQKTLNKYHSVNKGANWL
jgi:hypothetical protein